MSLNFFIRENYIDIDPLLSEKSYKAITYIFQALVYLSPLFIFLYYYYYENKDGSEVINSIDDIKKLEKKRYYYNIIKGIIQAFIYILFAIRIYWFYSPNNSQISLAILINYLKNNKILDDKIYQILKQYKPDNIGDFVIKN